MSPDRVDHEHSSRPSATEGVVRLLVVAEVRLYRDGLRAALGARPQFDVVGTASTTSEALQLIADVSPSVVIVDMTSRASLSLSQAIRQKAPSIHVIAFGVEETEGDVLACAAAGLSGYVPAEASIDELVERIQCVMRGELMCTPRIAAALFRTVQNRDTASTNSPDVLLLTSRERDVLRLVNIGLSNKEIAVRLSIEVSTVKNHVHHVLEKLQVTSRAQAIAKMDASASTWRSLPARALRS
jgi:DNA-binding NarL/FixJ family response regulator